EAGGRIGNTVLNGGFQDVLAGGIVGGTVVKGGYEFVFAGGTANGNILSAGTIELASGGSADQVTFAGAGTLRLNDSIHFGGLVHGVGLNEALALADIAANGATSATFTEAANNLSGTLSVTDGSHTANLTLLGQYVTAQFHVQTDGAGGTIVTDPPIEGT